MSAAESARRRQSEFCEPPCRSYSQGSTPIEPLVLMLTAAAALVTVVQLAAEMHWFADLFTHFRVQYVLAAGTVLLLSVLLRKPKCAAVLIVCIALNAWTLLPYLPMAASAASAASTGSTAPAASAGTRLSILSANVRGTSADTKNLLELVAATRPGVLLVVEHTPPFDKALAALHGEYPYRVSAPADGAFGIALYSRFPAVDAEVFRLGPSDAVRATIEHERGAIDFIGVHLMPPTTAEWALARKTQIDRLTKMLADGSTRSVVCGDYNLSPYSPHFSRLLDATGIGDPRAGRGFARTWPVGFLPLGIPIDHCLTGNDFEVIDVTTLGDIGSDHYPLLIEITPGMTQ